MDKIENLCIEGGGVKGLCYIGSFSYLYEKGILQNVKKVIGSSIGAVFALAVALKVEPKNLEQIVLTKDFSEFEDYSWGHFLDVPRLINSYGVCNGDKIKEWFNELICIFTGKKHMTFEELYNFSKIEFVVTATNLNNSSTEYFSYKLCPKMDVALALRMSISIPFFYKPVFYNNNMYVDGGMLNNYPIYFFDNHNEMNNEKTLGLKLMAYDEKEEHGIIEYDRSEIKNIKDYTEILINCNLNQIERGHIRQDYWERTVVINTGKIQTTEFNLSKEKKEWLIQQGYQGCKKYFEKN